MVFEVKLCIWCLGFVGYLAANTRALARSQDDSTQSISRAHATGSVTF